MKIERRENFRVVVFPTDVGDFGGLRLSTLLTYGTGPDAQARIERDMRARCDGIVAAVKRHCDDVSSVVIECDCTAECSHCGREWEEEPGLCCAADGEERQA